MIGEHTLATDKKIAVVTTAYDRPIMLVGVYYQNALVVIDYQEFTSQYRTLSDMIPEQLKNLDDHVIIINEVNSFFSRFGRAVSLSDCGFDRQNI